MRYVCPRMVIIISESAYVRKYFYIVKNKYKFQALSLFAVAGKNGKKGHLFSLKREPGGQSKEQLPVVVKLLKSSVLMKSAYVQEMSGEQSPKTSFGASGEAPCCWPSPGAESSTTVEYGVRIDCQESSVILDNNLVQICVVPSSLRVHRPKSCYRSKGLDFALFANKCK